MNLYDHIRDIPDFPKPGIIFKDITPLLKDPAAFKYTVDRLAEAFADDGVTAVVGIESRGFIFGGVVARQMDVAFIPMRKAGKLPADTIAETYDLEYGTDTVEIHRDALGRGDRVVIIDDLLATGGTMAAAANLVKKTGAGVAGIACVVELAFLNGRARMPDCRVVTLLHY